MNYANKHFPTNDRLDAISTRANKYVKNGSNNFFVKLAIILLGILDHQFSLSKIEYDEFMEVFDRIRIAFHNYNNDTGVPKIELCSEIEKSIEKMVSSIKSQREEFLRLFKDVTAKPVVIGKGERAVDVVSADFFKKCVNKILSKIFINDTIHNMRQVKIDRHDAVVKDQTSKMIANRIDTRLKEIKNWFQTVAGDNASAEFLKHMKNQDQKTAITEYYTKIRTEWLPKFEQTIEKFYKTVEAFDSYMNMFTDALTNNPDLIKTVKSSLDEIEIVSDWDNIRVFKDFS